MNNSIQPLFLVSLLVVCAGLAMSSCSRTADQSPQQQRDSIAKLLETYIDAYKTGDFGKAGFAADVTFEGPLTNGRIAGKPAVQKFLSTVRAKDVRVKRQIIDGQFACVLADFETTEGIVVPFCEFFRIRNGLIVEIRPYFDPRPLVRKACFQFRFKGVDGEHVLLHWSAQSANASVDLGVDTFVIRDGRIVLQMVLYQPKERNKA